MVGEPSPRRVVIDGYPSAGPSHAAVCGAWRYGSSSPPPLAPSGFSYRRVGWRVAAVVVIVVVNVAVVGGGDFGAVRPARSDRRTGAAQALSLGTLHLQLCSFV